MIEVIYKEENQDVQEEAAVSIPRNIRQIGQADDNCKIYMEDYVYTFLVRLSRSEEEEAEQKAKVAVLTGDSEWMAGTSYLFIRGALMVEDTEISDDHIDFTDEVWKKIQEEQEKYFPEQEIAGWFFSRPQISMEADEIFARIHLKYFGGEKVLMLMEPQEREDAFFRYENGLMVKQKGYYIFYEKNPQMQAYMIEKNGELQTERAEKCEDKAVKKFRKIITDKKQEEKEYASVFSYAATACLAAAVLMVGVNFYKNYQGMKNIESEIKQASSVIVKEVTPVPTQKLPVPSKVPGRNRTASEKFSEKTQASPSPAPEKVREPEKNMGAEETTQKENVEREAAEKERPEKETEKEIEKEIPEKDVVQETRREISEKPQEKEKEAPEAKMKQNPEKTKREEPVAARIHESYVIKPGDTIYQISMARYGNMDAMEEICRLNGLTMEEIIYPGQVIVLP